METIEVTTTLATNTCTQCGTLYAMPVRMQQERRRDHATFYCPQGHQQYYPGKSDEEKLREQLATANKRIGWAETRAQAAQDQADTAEHRRRAQKAVTTKLKKRIAAGVCPCCRRNFQDLHRHMAGQHPDFVE